MKNWKPSAALVVTFIFGVGVAGEMIRVEDHCETSRQVCVLDPLVHATDSGPIWS